MLTLSFGDLARTYRLLHHIKAPPLYHYTLIPYTDSQITAINISIVRRHHIFQLLAMDSVPNNADSLQTRIDNAKAFLRENPDEKIACAAQIFKLAHTTLYGSIARDKKPISRGQRGGQNKILDEHHVKVVHQFIRYLLAYGIEPSRGVVFNAIVNLKHAQNPENKAPTQRWFRTWWKSNNLHKITTKPLAVVQFTAGQEMDIRAWFVDYRQALGALQIKNEKNIVNFDEAGFRVGCMRGLKILAPVDVLEVRTYLFEPLARQADYVA